MFATKIGHDDPDLDRGGGGSGCRSSGKPARPPDLKTTPPRRSILRSRRWTPKGLAARTLRRERAWGAVAGGRSGWARGRFPGAARAQAAPLHEPERRQAPPFGGMSGGRAFQIGPAHEGGGPGRGNPPDVEVFRLGNSGTIVSLWHFCISFSDAYTEGRGVTAWRRLRPAAQRAPTRRSESRTVGPEGVNRACVGGGIRPELPPVELPPPRERPWTGRTTGLIKTRTATRSE